MNTDLAPVEIYIPADAWLKPVAVPHSMTHEDIDRLVSEFESPRVSWRPQLLRR